MSVALDTQPQPGVVALVDRFIDRLLWRMILATRGVRLYAVEFVLTLVASVWGWWVWVGGWHESNRTPFALLFYYVPWLPPVVSIVGAAGLIGWCYAVGVFGLRTDWRHLPRLREYSAQFLTLFFFALSLSTALTRFSSTAVPAYAGYALLGFFECLRHRAEREPPGA